jgi:tRNA1Val (adenine37-N6)-methyltransferase
VSNNYFQFKQFTIQQDKCAMKVCTDACLFGAWTADYLQHKNIFEVLDIGTGTGLLSLMLAQKTTAEIDAVEIEADAYRQAAENFAASPCKERLHIQHTDILRFDTEKKYDFIISNPPFFEADLKSLQQNKNAAKHDTTLTLDELCSKVKKLISKDGCFAVLLPFYRTEYFINEMFKQEMFCTEKILIKQTPAHNYFRSILLFNCTQKTFIEKEIIIKAADGNYSKEFIALLKDYYLHL